MAQTTIHRLKLDQDTLELLKRERAKALSPREWKFRLAGYGYAVKDVMGRQMLTRLPQGTIVGQIPAQGL